MSAFFIFLVLAIDSVSPVTHPELQLADSLLLHGQNYEAATEYERFLFAHPDDSLASGVRCRLVQATARDGRIDRAEEFLALIPAKKESLAWEARYALATACAENDRPYQARAEFLDLLSISPDSGRRPDVYRQLGWLDAADGEFESAARRFAQTGDTQISLVCESLSSLPRRDPNFASLLSTFLPGAGEMYAGGVKTGLFALAANGAVVAAVVYSLLAWQYLDAALVFTAFAGRFYFGSRNNARDFAEDYNRMVSRQAAAELRRRFGRQVL